MSNWDEDSPALRVNLARAMALLQESALARNTPSLDEVRVWHSTTMQGLDVPDPSVIGNFRGEAPGYLAHDVEVAGQLGAPYQKVREQSVTFRRILESKIVSLDEVIPAQPTTEDQIDLVLEIAAWAHAQWVRIHPFSNGNGRTARMWANWVLLRYEMPPLASLRPRPGGAYSAASTAAMQGQVEPTILVFQEMFTEWLADH